MARRTKPYTAAEARLFSQRGMFAPLAVEWRVRVTGNTKGGGWIDDTQVFTTRAQADAWARGYAHIGGLDIDVTSAQRHNPAPAAAALYQSWTGEPSTHETVITDTVHDHTHLADLARLVAVKLRGVRGQLKFTDHTTRLCSNEAGTQLYIRGGDQAVNLTDFNSVTNRPVDTTKDSLVLGTIDCLFYAARKPFLGAQHSKMGVYKHTLGEESGNRPVLLYDTRSRLLSISGGAYYIKPGDYDGTHSRGIVD